MPRQRLWLVLLIVVLNGCATTQVTIVGQARPPIDPAIVQIYLEPPAARYVEIANIGASNRTIDKVVERLKSEAAKLGANGVLLHGVGHEAAAALGAHLDAASDTGHSPYGIGFGAFGVLSKKSGDGIAIYVSPK